MKRLIYDAKWLKINAMVFEIFHSEFRNPLNWRVP